MNNKDDGFRISMEILFRDSIEVLIFHRRDSFSSHAVWRRLNTKLLRIEEHLGTIHAERGVHFLALYFLSHSSFNLGEYEDTLAHTNNIVGVFNSICGGRLTFFRWQSLRGRSLAYLGRFDEAEQLFRECLAWKHPPQYGGGANPILPLLNMYLAETLKMRGDDRGSEEVLDPGLEEEKEADPGLEKEEVLDSGLEEAEEISRDCCQKLEMQFGDKHQLTLDSLEIRAAILKRCGRVSEADMMLMEYERRVKALSRIGRWGAEMSWIDGCM